MLIIIWRYKFWAKVFFLSVCENHRMSESFVPSPPTRWAHLLVLWQCPQNISAARPRRLLWQVWPLHCHSEWLLHHKPSKCSHKLSVMESHRYLLRFVKLLFIIFGYHVYQMLLMLSESRYHDVDLWQVLEVIPCAIFTNLKNKMLIY